MPDLTLDFLESRKKQNRFKKFVFASAIFLVVAGSTAAGWKLYEKWAHEPEQKVAGSFETVSGSCVLSPDWLLKYFGTTDASNSLVGGGDADPDGDVLTNCQEVYFATNPADSDTDRDGELDGLEIAFGSNPNGSGELYESAGAEEYVKSLGEDYQEFSQENIRKQVEAMFQPDRSVVMDLPSDSELKITSQNDVAAFEKYFEETKGLSAAEDSDIQNIQENLLNLPPAELDRYIAHLETTIKILKDIPVPSELLNIHKFKIAGLRAGAKIFELVKNNYRPEGDNQQFWSDFFSQMIAVEQASGLELAAWNDIGQRLRDQGGI